MTKSPRTSHAKIKAFQAQIWTFYRHSGRHSLPWRRTRDPYKIMVSEVMLQQTQVARVLEKYPEFLRKFPTAQALANAPLSEVLRMWQGMGYNRRARYLRDTALMIATNHKGRIPKTENQLRTLPGIGHYTANAIRTFAHNEPAIFIETNIRRVFIHIFFNSKEKVTDKEILPLIKTTLDTENPREWYYALMDYGAQLPKIVGTNPNTKSKHHTKQEPFKGSLRELRGKIIRILSESSKTLLGLRRLCNNDPRTEGALHGLVRDHLVNHENKKYQLA